MRTISNSKTVQSLRRFTKAMDKANTAAPEAIRAYRQSMGMTQKDMGEQLGIHGVTFCLIETNKRAAPVEVLRRFHNILQGSNSLM